MTRRRAGGRPLGAFVAILLQALAASATIDPTLRSPGEPETWIRPTLRLDGAFFAERHAWAGNATELIGDTSHGWAEFGVVPGLEGQLSLGRAGTLRGGASGVFTTTQFGLDAAGSNLDDRDPLEVTLEDAYLGWRSGDLIPGLDRDALDLSVGSQPYAAGTGFLFSDGGSDGGRRGGYWLNLRKAFRLTAIARLATGPLLAEAMYLRPNEQPDSSTEVAGLNAEWSFGERATLGGGYWNVFDSDDERRDGLHVFDLRFESSPLATVAPGLRLCAEVAHERNGSRNRSWGAYGEAGYAFDDLVWSPYLSYRYAHFTGDDGDGANGAFDPLFYGYDDWGTWYLGEIAGEWVATNRNLGVHTVRLRLAPTESVTANLLFFYFRLDEFANGVDPRPPSSPRGALIRDKSLAQEIDLAVDWQLGEHLALSVVGAVLVPFAGAKDFFGDDRVWSQLMLALSVNF